MMNVSIVDDHESVLRALRRLLAAEGINATTFSNPEEYLHALQSGEIAGPDCLVADVHMPQMTGLELHRKLRVCNISFPVIMITADDDGQVREQALAQGAFAVLKKPFTDEVFLKTITSAVDGAEITD